MYLLHGKKDSQENHFLKKRSLGFAVPVISNPRYGYGFAASERFNWLRIGVRFICGRQRAYNSILTTVPCNLEETDHRNDIPARNKSTLRADPAIKGARHWVTKGMFFENVIYLGIILSMQKIYSNLQRNRLFSISVSPYTEIVPKNVLSG